MVDELAANNYESLPPVGRYPAGAVLSLLRKQTTHDSGETRKVAAGGDFLNVVLVYFYINHCGHVQWQFGEVELEGGESLWRKSVQERFL